jgi:preprotein translocase subunit SecD
MRGSKSAVTLFAIVAVLIATTIIFTVVYPIKNIMKLGLDLKGGVHLVLEGVDSDAGKVTPEAVKAAAKVIENRINKMGVSEPVVQTSGNRIVVELAGVKDPEEARKTLGETAVLKFLDPDGNVVLDGKDVASATPTPSSASGYEIVLKLKGDGPKKFADATTKLAASQQPIRIMLDQNEISAPTVQVPILDGVATITGNFTAASATQLSDLINGGALPIKLELKENRVVSASLGIDSLAKSAKAGIIGLIGVVLFMLFMYRLPGVIATIALVIYSMLTLGFLLGINAVFTLPGLAGLLLSIGMAVDGNVIIFERIKEELRKGKGLRSGIDAGFHRAISAVIDGQVTTMIAGVVLWYLGTGPIKGFALTLIVGVVLSMFTAITVTRWLLNLLVGTGWVDKRMFGVKEVAR